LATHSFDIVVLGGELSGLIAATLSAERGYRVALVRGEVAPTSYELGEHVLPVEPFSLVGLDTPVVQRAVEELHFSHVLRRKAHQHAPSFQLVTPDARIDVDGDDDELARELARELAGIDRSVVDDLPRESAAIVEGLDQLLPTGGLDTGGFRQRREHNRQLAQLGERAAELIRGQASPLIRALLAAPAAATSPLAADQVSDISRLRTFDQWRRGTPRIEGDFAGLCDLLLDKFQNHGGEIIDDRPVEVTHGWGGKVTALVTRSGDKLGANQMIAALAIDELAVLLGEKGLKKISEHVDAFLPAGYRYTLNLVVDEAGIPEGMGRTVLCVRDVEAPLSGDNFLRIHVGDTDDRGRVVITASAICPAQHGSRTVEDELADLRVEVRQSLELVMPFFSQHVVLVHSPHELAPAEGPAGAVTKQAMGRAFTPRPIWRVSNLGNSFVALPHQVGLKNLIMASPQVLPGLGLEGEFAAGLSAARVAAQGVGKRKPHREVLG
jgi:hypothetical protein